MRKIEDLFDEEDSLKEKLYTAESIADERITREELQEIRSQILGYTIGG